MDKELGEIYERVSTGEMNEKDKQFHKLKSCIRCLNFNSFQEGKMSKGKLCCEVIASALISEGYPKDEEVGK